MYIKVHCPRMPQHLDMNAFQIFWKSEHSRDNKSDSNIICSSLNNASFLKITRMCLKNWACHAHFKFETILEINMSIFKVQTTRKLEYPPSLMNSVTRFGCGLGFVKSCSKSSKKVHILYHL